MWKVGNDRKIKFWEDHWFGSCSLATQFWELYIIANEQNSTIAEVWDGAQLRFSFRRNVSQRLMLQWYDLLQVAGSICLSEEDDAVIWKWEAKGTYSVSSLYSVINYRG